MLLLTKDSLIMLFLLFFLVLNFAFLLLQLSFFLPVLVKIFLHNFGTFLLKLLNLLASSILQLHSTSFFVFLHLLESVYLGFFWSHSLHFILEVLLCLIFWRLSALERAMTLALVLRITNMDNFSLGIVLLDIHCV